MRKIILSMLCLFSIFILVGCESSQEDIPIIFTALKEAKIISDSMEQIDKMSYSHWPTEMCKTETYYIYKDKDSKMIAIRYENIHYNGSKFDNLVTIYFDVTINKDVKNIGSEDAICDSRHSYYVYQNGEYTDNSRYNFGTKKKYYATKKSSSLKGNYYSLQSAE